VRQDTPRRDRVARENEDLGSGCEEECRGVLQLWLGDCEALKTKIRSHDAVWAISHPVRIFEKSGRRRWGHCAGKGVGLRRGHSSAVEMTSSRGEEIVAGTQKEKIVREIIILQ